MKTDREVDLEAANEYLRDQNQVRQDALHGFVTWVEAEAKQGRYPVANVVVQAARKALKGER